MLPKSGLHRSRPGTPGPVYLGKMQADGQFEIVWTSQKPIRPVPYPITRSKSDWDAFLDGLYKQWGNTWANPVDNEKTTVSASPKS